MENFILITGASTGIGAHLCQVAITHGYHVLGGVRHEEDRIRLEKAFPGLLTAVLMDVTDEAQIAAAFDLISAKIQGGRLVAIVNNAGVVVSGAVLYIPLKEWQRQFEVNLMGVIRITQTFFPLLVKSDHDPQPHPRRIINISSVSGLFASPFLGPYAASKYALEAMSDALRRELYMYDIQVVLLEPGNISTPIWEKARKEPSWLGPEYEQIRNFKDAVVQRNIDTSVGPEALDRYFLKALTSRSVNPRYLIRKGKWKFQLIRLLPAKWLDHLIRRKLQSGAGIRPF